MTRQVGISVENLFTNGLVTEATGLNFPENAVTETYNCIFDRKGLVKRRLGFDYEASDATVSTIASGDRGYVCSVFKWQTVGGAGNVNFVVLQVGKTIYFYEIIDGDILSDQRKSFTINLATYKTASQTDNELRQERASFSSGNGYLFIAHKFCEPLYVSYDQSGDSITVNEITVQIRDFEGLNDGFAVDQRPTDGNQTDYHEYNLHNQGWYFINNYVSGVPNSSVLEKWHADRTTAVDAPADWPSNSDVWFQYKNSSGVVSFTDIPAALGKGNTPAAKGHHILDAFNIVRRVYYPHANTIPAESAASGAGYTTIQTEDTDDIRPQFTEFFSSRVWWAGVKFGKHASKIYFSKIIEGDDDFGKCYQVNDPTSELLADLLPSDGGVIVIPEIAEVIFMKAYKSVLLVFGSNGVWSISGTDTQGFTADNYQINKITDIGCLSPYSFVSVDNIPIWWNSSAIFTIQASEVGQNLEVARLSDTKIKTFFDNIPLQSKRFAQGTYNPIDRTVSWIYRSTAASTFTDNFKYDRVLNFDLTTQAFYPDTISDAAYKVSSVVNVSQDVGDVFSNKFFLIGYDAQANNTLWAEKNSDTYLDWYTLDSTGVDYSSYFTTGYKIRGDTIRNQDNPYISLTSEVNENNSFFISLRWDYDISKASTQQQGYTHNPDKYYTQTRLRLRGEGKVLQYHVKSETGKPFSICGWSSFETVAGGI